MTSPLAVRGTDKPVETPDGSLPTSLSWSGASCVRPVRKATAAGASELNGRTSCPPLPVRADDAGPDSRTSSRTSPLSPGTWTEHESASRPSTRLMVRRITVVGSRLELNSRVTSDRSERRSRPASASRRASRSCSNTWARSKACAVSPANVERNRRSGSLGSGCATKASDSTPSGPALPMRGSLTIVTGLGSSRKTRATISTATSSRTPSSAAMLATPVRPCVKHVPVWLPSRGTVVRERSAGCPLLARQVRPPSPATGTRTTADCAPSARRPPGNGRMGHVAGRRGRSQGRAELVQVLTALQVDELGQGKPGPLDRLGRRARDGEEEGPIGLGDLSVVVPVHHDGADGVVGHDERDDGEGPEPVRIQ